MSYWTEARRRQHRTAAATAASSRRGRRIGLCAPEPGPRRLGQKRVFAWDPAETFDDLHPQACFLEDRTEVKPATVRTLGPGPGFGANYLTDARWPDDDDDDWDADDHRYAFARRAWADMDRAPRDAAAAKLQGRLRGRGARRRYLLVVRARGRWLKRDVARAWRCWAGFSAALGVAGRTCLRVLGMLRDRDLARGFNAWIAHDRERRRAERLAWRVLCRLAETKLSAGLRTWTALVAWERRREALARRVVLGLLRRRSRVAFATWAAAAEALSKARADAAVRRTMVRLADGAARLAAAAWASWRLVVKSERRAEAAARLAGCEVVILRMVHGLLAKAFDALRKTRKTFALDAAPPAEAAPAAAPPPRGPRMRLLGARSRPPPPRRASDGDAALRARLASLESVAKQLQCMRLEEQLGQARAVARGAGWHPHRDCPCGHFGTDPSSGATLPPPPARVPVVRHEAHYAR